MRGSKKESLSFLIYEELRLFKYSSHKHATKQVMNIPNTGFNIKLTITSITGNIFKKLNILTPSFNIGYVIRAKKKKRPR